jgi:hypothetical protein
VKLSRWNIYRVPYSECHTRYNLYRVFLALGTVTHSVNEAPAIPPDSESAHDLTFPFLHLNPGVLFGLVTVTPIPEDYTEACQSL